MTLHSLYRMPVSPREAWPELTRVDSMVARTFLLLALPLSLLPPALMYLVGSDHGDAFVAGYSAKPWGTIAVAFFAGEMASVAFMGWMIKQAARWWEEDIDYRSAYVIAAVAAVPLWMSSLGLLVPSLAFNIALSGLALAVSCALLFQGIRSFCRHAEDDVLRGAEITQVVFGAGLGVWGFLLLVLIV
jgi:hypothetical protein